MDAGAYVGTRGPSGLCSVGRVVLVVCGWNRAVSRGGVAPPEWNASRFIGAERGARGVSWLWPRSGALRPLLPRVERIQGASMAPSPPD
jgi:hypothetical protein